MAWETKHEDIYIYIYIYIYKCPTTKHPRFGCKITSACLVAKTPTPPDIYIYVYIYIYIKRKKCTIGLCGEILLYEQSQLIKGLWFWSSKLVESMAAPLHGSPLIFHWFEFVEIPHFWNIVFSAVTAITFTIKHHCDQSNIHPPKLPLFKRTILFRKKERKFIKSLY